MFELKKPIPEGQVLITVERSAQSIRNRIVQQKCHIPKALGWESTPVRCSVHPCTHTTLVNVYTTSITLERHQMNVKATLCAYWWLKICLTSLFFFSWDLQRERERESDRSRIEHVSSVHFRKLTKNHLFWLSMA